MFLLFLLVNFCVIFSKNLIVVLESQEKNKSKKIAYIVVNIPPENEEKC